MVYGRSKAVPPPATPFEEFMATASDKMTAARLEFIEALREMPPAAWIAIGVVILVLAASSLNWRGKKEASGEPAATANAVAAEAKARSWLSSITKSGEGRATEAVAPPAEARTVATPENKPPPMSRAKSVRKAAAKLTGMSGAFSGKKKDAAPKAGADKADAAAAPAPASTKEAVVEKVEVATDKAEAAAARKVDEAAAAAKTGAKDKVDAASMAWGGRGDRSDSAQVDEAAGKLGVDAPPVSMDVFDQAAELTKGKVAEGGAATDDAVKKAVVGPAQ